MQINRNIIPGFYRLLQEQNSDKQIEYAEELKTEVRCFRETYRHWC